MPQDKEADKGMMHHFFGAELCDGCKGLMVVAFIAPSPRDISAIAASFAKYQKDVEDAGQQMSDQAKKQPKPDPFNPPGA